MGVNEVVSEQWEMNAYQGVVRNGQVVFDGPLPLPEGTRVEVLAFPASPPLLGMREEDWPTTAEDIAAMLARMDSFEPGWLSPEDDSAWRNALREQREMEKTRIVDDAHELRTTWQ
jgi:hypothetical protein